MEKHLHTLQSLKDNDVKYVRWHTIDNFMYIVVSPSITEMEVLRVKSLFVECDWFSTYTMFAIDLDKQRYPKPQDPYKKPERTKIKFEKVEL